MGRRVRTARHAAGDEGSRPTYAVRGWRLAVALIAAMALGGLVGIPLPRVDAAVTRLPVAQECQQALGEPNRTPADRVWLAQCVHALSPATSPPSTATYRTAGRFLLDPEGSRVVLRGAEQVFWDTTWLLPSFVTELGRSGANGVRVLPYYQQQTPTGEPRSSLAQIEEMIRRGIDSHMLVDVAIDGGRDPSVYLRPEVRALLLRYEKYLVLHAKGGSDDASDDQWVASSVATIAALRAAGYRAPLSIMTRTGGRNLLTLLHRGQEVVDADPLHNVVFGWHARWGSDNQYQNEYGLSLTDAMLLTAAAPFPIQVGLSYHADPQSGSLATVPYSNLMRLAQELSVGWLWWDWRMGVDELTVDGRYLHWGERGEEVVLTNANSIQRTSVRTSFQLNSVAP